MLSALTVVALIAAAAMPCENLKSISLQNTAITISEFVPERQVQPGERGRGQAGRGGETRGQPGGPAGERRLELMSSAGSEPEDLGDGEAPRQAHLIGPWGSPASAGLAAGARQFL